MPPILLASALLLLAALGVVSPAPATTYDASADFSLSSNPNGVWSYGTLSAFTGGSLTLFSLPLPDGQFPNDATWPEGTVNAWDNGGTFPNQDGIFHNKTSDTVTGPNSTAYIPPGVLDLGGQNQITTLRWTAPAAGTYTISGFFERIDTNAYPVNVRIVENGTTVLFSADSFTTSGSKLPFTFFSVTLAAGATLDFAEGSSQPANLSTGIAVDITNDPHPAFFMAQVALSNGVYYLAFPANGNVFGYYSYLTDPHYLYHQDLGYEYVFDAADGHAGVFLYDFKSQHFFYTSPSFPFPYLYDFSLNTVLYYYPDPDHPGRYNTNGTRYFYDYASGQIITE